MTPREEKGRQLDPCVYPWSPGLGTRVSELPLTSATLCTCADSHQHSRQDDQLKGPGHFADSHQDGRSHSEDIVDQQCSFSARQRGPRGQGFPEQAFPHRTQCSRLSPTNELPYALEVLVGGAV